MEKNNKSGAEIKISPIPPTDITQLINQIFWKEPEAAEATIEFLEYIREWSKTESPYTTPEWKNYCEKKAITQSRYHNILRRLKKIGMIKKTYNRNRGVHEIYLNNQFSHTLRQMAELWDEYLQL